MEAVYNLRYVPLVVNKVCFNSRIVGDNIDLMIDARIQTASYGNRSLHWTQQYGVLNRVIEPLLNEKEPQRPMPEIELGDLLPVKFVQDNLVYPY